MTALEPDNSQEPEVPPPVLSYVSPPTQQRPAESMLSRVVYGTIAVGLTFLFGMVTLGELVQLVGREHGEMRDRLPFLGAGAICGLIAWISGVIAWGFIFPKQSSKNEIEASEHEHPPDDHAR